MNSSIRWSLATIVVAYPVFLFVVSGAVFVYLALTLRDDGEAAS